MMPLLEHMARIHSCPVGTWLMTCDVVRVSTFSGPKADSLELPIGTKLRVLIHGSWNEIVADLNGNIVVLHCFGAASVEIAD